MAKKNTITLPDGTVVSHKKPLKEQMYKYRWFYLMFLPVFIFVVVFYYLPMFGIVYSFTEYKLIKDPVWTGFKNFETLFSKPMFWRAFKNTLFLRRLHRQLFICRISYLGLLQHLFLA